MRVLGTSLFTLVVCILLPELALAQYAAPEMAQYRACLARVNENPDAAYDQAVEWRDNGGGAPAVHCSILALVGLGKHAEAAARFEALAATPGGRVLGADLFAQAGNAWLLAGRPEKAYPVFSAALANLPDHGRGPAADSYTDILIDRARALAALADWPASERDLSLALSRDPERTEAYVFRATARRYQEQYALALEDLELALALDPKNAAALLERGVVHRLSGRDQAARDDWLVAITLDPESETGRAAQQNLQLLDVKTR